MKSAFDRCMVWLVDHRGYTFLAVVLITVLAVIGHIRPDWVRQIFISPKANAEQPVAAQSGGGPRRGKSLSEGSQSETQRREAPKIDPVSLSASDAVLVVQSPQFFTPAGAKAMRHVVDELEKTDDVRSIL